MKPFRQGDLDCTCGIYSVVNAIRLALADCRHFSHADATDLYEVLMEQLEKSNGVMDTVLDGMCVPVISGLFQIAKLFLQKQGINLAWRKPYHTGRVPKLALIIDHYKAHLRTNGSVLFSIDGKYNHWSVARLITENSIMLFDSSVFGRIPIVQMSLSANTKKPYVLVPRETFFVSCKEET